jgi:hypothetical protein
MSEITKTLERDFTIPCGPMSIRANSICRKSLRDKFDALLNRLETEVVKGEVYQETLQGNSKMLQDVLGRL